MAAPAPRPAPDDRAPDPYAVQRVLAQRRAQRRARAERERERRRQLLRFWLLLAALLAFAVLLGNAIWNQIQALLGS